jgi:multidrug resistance efflux pump
MNDHADPRSTSTLVAGTDGRVNPLSLKERVRSLRLPDQPSRGQGGSSKLAWFLCLVLAGAGGYLGYRYYDAQEALRAAETAKNESMETTQTARPETAPGAVALAAGGYIVPVRRVQVAPKVGGEVLKLLEIDGREMREGDLVEKGTWLAEIDPSKYEYEYQRTKALADQAEAEWDRMRNGNREEEIQQSAAALREAEEIRDQLKDEAARTRRSRTAASADELVKIESRLLQAEAKVKQLAAASKMMSDGNREEDKRRAYQAWQNAKAVCANAKYDRDNCTVRAPVRGIILKKNAEVGNTVRPEAYSNGLSASLCEMADLRVLEVDVDVSERDLVNVFQGQKCEVRTEAFPDKMYQAYVDRLMPEANRSKASVSARVRIIIPENDTLLRPEMRARVVFKAPEKKSNADKDKKTK